MLRSTSSRSRFWASPPGCRRCSTQAAGSPCPSSKSRRPMGRQCCTGSRSIVRPEFFRVPLAGTVQDRELFLRPMTCRTWTGQAAQALQPGQAMEAQGATLNQLQVIVHTWGRRASATQTWTGLAPAAQVKRQRSLMQRRSRYAFRRSRRRYAFRTGIPVRRRHIRPGHAVPDQGPPIETQGHGWHHRQDDLAGAKES